MGNGEIRELFLQSDRQIPIQEEKRQQTYERVITELKKQRTPIAQHSNILFSQFQYMDKSFFLIYVILICLGTAFMFLLQKTGAGRNEIMIACMVGATVLGISTVILIDKLFFGRMAELGASCYFSTKQCVAVYMAATGNVNLIILFFTILYVDNYWKIGMLQIGLYVLTPFFLSNIVALGVLSTETGRRNPYFLFISCIFLSIGYAVFSAIPGIFYATSLGIWGIACAITGILLTVQLRRLFVQMEKAFW